MSLRKLSEMFRHLIARLRGVRKQNVAIVEVAAKLVTADRLTELITAMPDRRLFLEELANALGKSMPALLSELSRLSGLPKLDEIPEVAITPLEVFGGYQIEQFRSAGAAPIVQSGKLIGIACIDPATVAAMLPSMRGTQLYLACWSAIEQGYLSAKRFEESQANAVKQSKNDKLLSLAHRAIAALVREVHSFGRMTVNIMFEPSVIRYEFTTHEGRRAQGTINPHLSLTLGEVLESATASGILSISTIDGDFPTQSLQVYVVGDRSCFRLRWGNATGIADSSIRENANRSIIEARPSSESIPVIDETAASRAQIVAKSSDDSTKENSSLDYEALVVIVDDNPTFALVLERFFGRHGCKTRAFNSGTEALRGIASFERTPDLIVSDVHMPQMNGFDFIKRLRFEPGMEHVPVVMLTSDDDAETEIALISGGADAFVAKSEDPRVLWVHVKRLLARKNRGKEAA